MQPAHRADRGGEGLVVLYPVDCQSRVLKGRTLEDFGEEAAMVAVLGRPDLDDPGNGMADEFGLVRAASFFR